MTVNEARASAEHTNNPRVLPSGIPPLEGLDDRTHAAAITALKSGQVGWVVISGKMGAGKDTVAPLVADSLPMPTGKLPVLLSYGDLMRAELAAAINAYSQALGVAPGKIALRQRLVREATGLRDGYANELFSLLEAEFSIQEMGHIPSAFDRTENIRKMLQGLGGPWRTTDDPIYWVKKAAVAALTNVAAGRSVALTGARYLPDVEIPAQRGAIVIRLDIDRDTQLARLRARDGLAPTEATLAALDHPGETALDDWPGFTFRFSNMGALDDTVQEVNAVLAYEFARRREVAHQEALRQNRNESVMISTEPTPRHSGGGYVDLPVLRLDPELDLPSYEHPGDAGLDLRTSTDVTLGPGERALVPTGIAVAIPEGFVGLIHPRSGLAARHGLSIVNTPGTVDAGYRGEIQVCLVNLDPRSPIILNRGDRIAQLVIQPVTTAILREVTALPPSLRGAGGFGSTGGFATGEE